MTLAAIIGWASSLLQLPLLAAWLVLSGYLVFLTGSAAIGRGRRREQPQAAVPTTRFSILVPAHNEALVIGPCLQFQEHWKIEDFRCCWCSAPDVGEELELLGWCRGVDPVVLSTHQIVVRLWHFGERARFQDLREAGSVKNASEEVKKTHRKWRDSFRIF